MHLIRRPSWYLALALCYLTLVQGTDAAVLFQDDFQSDTAGQTGSGSDLDPVIGAGDIGGSWIVRESTSLHTQVINDSIPGNGVGSTDNFLQLIRGGSSSSVSRPYATSWSTASTLNKLVQLDFSMWQQVSGDLTVVFLNQAPPSSTGNPNFANASVFVDLATTTGGSVVAVPDLGWHTIRVIANMSSSTTQWGIAPQKYLVTVDGSTSTTINFNAPNNQVQSIGFYSGANNKTEYIDNVRIQAITTPEPASACVWGLVLGLVGWFGWKKS